MPALGTALRCIALFLLSRLPHVAMQKSCGVTADFLLGEDGPGLVAPVPAAGERLECCVHGTSLVVRDIHYVL